MIKGTDYGRPERKQPSLHGQKFNPNPKFLGAAEAYFVCRISPIFQIPYARHYKPRLVFFFTHFTLWLRLVLQSGHYFLILFSKLNSIYYTVCTTYILCRYVLEMSSSWNFPARASPSCEGSEPSRAGAL